MKTVSFERLYHIGTLNPADKFADSSVSMEGRGLSVSQFPEAWRHIARLGGRPLWRLTRPENRFLDVYALTQAERRQVESWGVAEGWARLKTVWVATVLDCESNETREIFCETKAHAIAADDDVQLVMPRDVVAATAHLNDYHGFPVPDVWAGGLLAVAYADQVLQLDGVFWSDDLDPYALSAPRAVIVPARVASWSVAVAESREWSWEPGCE